MANTKQEGAKVQAGKLLLVEDDPSLSELLEYRFTNEGYDVRATADGDEDAPLVADCACAPVAVSVKANRVMRARKNGRTMGWAPARETRGFMFHL